MSEASYALGIADLAMMAKGELQETRRTGGVNEIAPGIRRDVKVGRANNP
jgi:hypothetical protein